jgi:RNA polymerase sigma-70 factor, ECF subfamily
VIGSQTADSTVRQNNSEQTRDEDLIDSAAKGDTAAFDVLVNRYRGIVLAVTRRITGNLDDAEDVMQEAFMKAFIKLSTFEGRSSFSTWLVSIARNEALMLKRRGHIGRTMSIFTDSGEEYLAPVGQLSDLQPSPEISHAQSEMAGLLVSAMDRLKPEMRTALQLCDLEESSIGDVAMRLGISVRALKSRRVRGRRVLRRILTARLFRCPPITMDHPSFPARN